MTSFTCLRLGCSLLQLKQHTSTSPEDVGTPQLAFDGFPQPVQDVGPISEQGAYSCGVSAAPHGPPLPSASAAKSSPQSPPSLLQELFSEALGTTVTAATTHQGSFSSIPAPSSTLASRAHPYFRSFSPPQASGFLSLRWSLYKHFCCKIGAIIKWGRSLDLHLAQSNHSVRGRCHPIFTAPVPSYPISRVTLLSPWLHTMLQSPESPASPDTNSILARP